MPWREKHISSNKLYQDESLKKLLDQFAHRELTL